MSVTDSGNGPNRPAGVKTLAIRLEPDLHAELTLIAQLREQTITDEIREAIETHIVRIKSDPTWANKADDVLAEIERQAAKQRDAFARLFGTADQPDEQPSTDAAPSQPAEPAPGGRGRRRSSASDS
ncbi:hypothetical protein [Nakamurella multipartita]|uniref:Uncharacterized protein n=1 Tax=Nakamurella multipartita (strain ATCC 700099 / DSM 44233 / CIP 104796 / JCM 9543 / NBRC 105858 / Y-104) TaxID=479431 RepID=C8X7R0_NAKMY|nr:hypothetical protein [Nakamurella multipartita]ACV80913.1 hypothetical protein Namu_4635 [Nakamurella multipartita DSM 44233]